MDFVLIVDSINKLNNRIKNRILKMTEIMNNCAATLSKNECSICFDEICGNKNCTTTECGHMFHSSCIFKNINFNGFSCPMCRNEFVEPSEDTDSDSDSDDDEDDYEDEDPYERYGAIPTTIQQQEAYVLRSVRLLFSNAENSNSIEENEKKIFEKLKEQVTYEDMARSIMSFGLLDSYEYNWGQELVDPTKDSMTEIYNKLQMASNNVIIGEEDSYWD
jgi:hypothetical protein